MRIRISLRRQEQNRLREILHRAYRNGQLRLVKRIHAIMYILQGMSVNEVSSILGISPQTVYTYVKAFILKRCDSLTYRRPPGRPPKLTKSQRRRLAKLIDDGPEAAGYDCGCWNTGLIQDLILTHFGVEYNPHYIAELLKTMGYSYQKARFVSDHLGDVADERKEWLDKTWPELIRQAKKRRAWVLFGDECSFAQWGSLSYTWAKRGEQPVCQTSGQRKAYKVFGFIEYFSGTFFSKTHSGKFTSDSYQAFIREILARTTRHLFIIQDGARYHTSKAVREFFATHSARITMFQLPRYSPDFNPIEYLWRNVKSKATHLRYFPTFDDLTRKVDEKLQYFANLPASIKGLMGKYCETLGDVTT
jgi:transposase